MIEITMNTARFKLTVKGHAEPGESDQYKEICAAASALAQALAYSISKFPGDAMKSFEYRPEPGDLLIRAYPEDWAELGTKNRFKAYAEGLELLALSHPQSITMILDGEKIIPEKEART